MARSHYVAKARNNIYEHGSIRRYKSKKGMRKGQMLEALDRTMPKNKEDKILIKKGEPYYWYQFKGQEKTITKEAPRPQDLTRSAFYQSLYTIQDMISQATAGDTEEFDTVKNLVLVEIESLKDECQERLDAMPESLQESSSSGELLRERIDALESWYSDIDSIDLDADESNIRGELEDDYDDEDDLKEAIRDRVLEKVNEALEELQNCEISL
jgi:hypothetical protein